MKNLILSFLGIFVLNISFGQDLKLWYTEPATKWEEALPIGNGKLAAMIYGDTNREIIQLNEETIWAGEPGNNIQDGIRPHLDSIRTLLFEGKNKEAQDLAFQFLPKDAPENGNNGMPYQPLGNLILNFPDKGKTTNYKRDLDISNAISHVNYLSDGVKYTRTHFASLTENVIVIEIESNKKGKVNFSMEFECPHKTYEIEVENNALILKGKSGDQENKIGKVKFTGMVKPVLKEGSISQNGKTLEIKNADKVTLYITAATNFKNYKDLSGNPDQLALSYLERANEKSFETLKEEHTSRYQEFFNRVQLDLGNMTESSSLPTNYRIANFDGKNDPS
ncbi:MAG: glycoside hydrolase family 95 protein, partial [Saprospiraceae bacterium]